MVNDIPFNHIILFFIFFLSNIIPKIHSYINFTYPYGIPLSNEKICVIHKFGICICDQNLSSIIKNVTEFIEEEELTDESLLRISTAYEYEYIIAIINYKIYIINNTWDLVDITTLNFINNDFIFSITPIELYESDEIFYYYLITYVDYRIIRFLYYRFCILEKSNDLIYNSNGGVKRYRRLDYLDYMGYYIENNGLSCQYMNQIEQKVLICFYLLKEVNSTILMLDFFHLPDFSRYYKIYSFFCIKLFQFNSIEPKYIKSTLNSDRDKALICVYSSENEFEFFGFDINNLDFESESDYCDFETEIDKFYFNNSEFFYSLGPFNRVKINYLNGKNDFVLSFNDESSIKLFFFSEDFNVSNITTFYKQENLSYCSNINDHVIFYSNNTSEYYVLPFAQICDLEHLLYELYKSEENENDNNMECKELDKCQKCNNQSISKNLCLECNIQKGYYILNINELPKSKINKLFEQYFDCVNNITKPENFYFNEENQDYEPCFLTCGACEYGGNQIENNCTLCGINFRNQPDVINSTNCVLRCNYFYYYTYFGEYKCTQSQLCPKEYSIFIPEKKKCINDCTKDDEYIYQYNGECLNDCPNNTNNESFICKDINTDDNKCIIVEKDLLPMDEGLIEYQSEILAKNYAKEFIYTNNHVSIYTNNIYSIIIYKNDECIKELSIEIIKIDFNECKKNIKYIFNIDNNLIIVIITKLINNLNYKKIIFYSIFNPNTTEKIITKNICENENFLIEENLRIKLEKANYDIDSLLYLAKQGINFFNLSDPFYNDICFPFDSLLEKDIALKDRILLYYPNISLCENDCEIRGVDITSLRSECSCKSNFVDHIFNDNNILFKNQELQEIKEIIRRTNIEIIRCYKNIFLPSNIRTCIGGLIIIILIIGQIISTILFFSRNIYLIRKYIFRITNKYINFLKIENMKNEPIMINNKPFDLNKRQQNRRVTKKEDEKIKIKRKRRKSKTRFIIQEDNKSRNLMLLNNNQNNSSNSIKIINDINGSNKNVKLENDYKVNIYDSNLINSKDILNISNNQKDNANPNILSESKEVKEYLSTEIDDMDFEDAIKRDKRKFCESNSIKYILCN